MGGWRLTRRGRIVFGGLGVLLLAGVGTVVDGPVTELARATGLGGGPREVTLIASGDVLPHGPVLRQAGAYGSRAGQPYDFRPMFADLRPVVAAADLAICHLEVPLSGDGRGVTSWPSFNAPPQLAAALRWAGYDACSTASNHALDRGPAGIAATLGVLDQAGLRHAGTARNAAEAAGAVVDARGLRIGLLSYAYGLNGGRVPADQPWLVNLLDPDRIIQDARAVRRAGARFVVVLLHWGQENQTAPTTSQRELARRLLAAPEVDLILGHHVHVVQPIEQVGDKWVAYGMGNSLSNQTPACCAAGSQDGVMVQVTVGLEGGVARVRAVRHVPTWVEHPSYRVRPVLTALTDRSLPAAARQALEASRDRTTRAVGPAAPALPPD
ncbi:MAG TPA: CapA family protein [Actinomycetota bacterium]|jgi:poly-gamma-glutamate synthesis protein (capsule biosynthesis protein)|nr:CapA family protein [Actinomycetota bacterium]